MKEVYSYGGSTGGKIFIGSYPIGSIMRDVVDSGIDVFYNLCTDEEVCLYGDYTKYVEINKKTNTRSIIVIIPTVYKHISDDSRLMKSVIQCWTYVSQGRRIYIHAKDDIDNRVIVFLYYFYLYSFGSSSDDTIDKIIRSKLQVSPQQYLNLSRSQLSQIRRYERVYSRHISKL